MNEVYINMKKFALLLIFLMLAGWATLAAGLVKHDSTLSYSGAGILALPNLYALMIILQMM